MVARQCCLAVLYWLAASCLPVRARAANEERATLPRKDDAAASSEWAKGLQFPGENIIVTNVRHEGEFIVEWLNYHLWIGFDHVVIYSQEDSEEDTEALRAQLSAYVARRLVTVRHWSRTGDQMGAFEDFFESHQRDGQRVLLTDVDEFLVLCEHATVGEYLRSIHGAPAQCLHFPYLQFGTSHIAEHPKGMPVTATYHLRKRNLDRNDNRRTGKVLIRSPAELKPDYEPAVHHDCGQWANVEGAEVAGGVARVNHYRLRGGIKDALPRRRARGYGYVFAWARQFEQRNIDVRVYQEPVLNEVSDPTMLATYSEYPGGALMLPQPPTSRRESPTVCRERVHWKVGM